MNCVSVRFISFTQSLYFVAVSTLHSDMLSYVLKLLFLFHKQCCMSGLSAIQVSAYSYSTLLKPCKINIASFKNWYLLALLPPTWKQIWPMQNMDGKLEENQKEQTRT